MHTPVGHDSAVSVGTICSVAMRSSRSPNRKVSGHFFDLLAEEVIFEYIITTPGYPRRVEGQISTSGGVAALRV